MSKVIILPDETLDLFYERTLRYLHAKYHSYTTNLERSPDGPAPMYSINWVYSGGKKSLVVRSNNKEVLNDVVGRAVEWGLEVSYPGLLSSAWQMLGLFRYVILASALGMLVFAFLSSLGELIQMGVIGSGFCITGGILIFGVIIFGGWLIVKLVCLHDNWGFPLGMCIAGLLLLIASVLTA